MGLLRILSAFNGVVIGTLIGIAIALKSGVVSYELYEVILMAGTGAFAGSAFAGMKVLPGIIGGIIGGVIAVVFAISPVAPPAGHPFPEFVVRTIVVFVIAAFVPTMGR